MPQQDRTVDSSKCPEGAATLHGGFDIGPLGARSRASEEAGAALARQLNGPLTALLLYMNEIKQQCDQFPPSSSGRGYLQQVVENALRQTERVCAITRQVATSHEEPVSAGNVRPAAPGVMFTADVEQKRLTKREREVLSLIGEGCSNKQGAIRMGISPRTFESHRAEAMRKLGAKNTAELVRKALLQSGAG